MVSIMPKKHRHHYIPAGLSRNFCLNEKVLYLYDVYEGNVVRSSPRDVFVKTEFHTVVSSEGEKDHNTIEDSLMALENIGIPALRRCIESSSILDEDRSRIAAFWAIQYLRAPEVREMVNKFTQQIIKDTASLLDKHGKLPPVPDELSKHGNNITDLLEKGIIKTKILPQMTMRPMILLPKIMDVILQMSWCLMKSDDGNYFALPDNPCSFVYEDYKSEDQRWGLLDGGVEMALPIGANHCLLAGWKKMPEKVRAAEARVGEINKRSAIFGDRFIVFPIESKKMMGFFRRFSEGKPEADVQSIPAPLQEGGGSYIIVTRDVFQSQKMREHYLTCKPIFKKQERKK